MKLVHLDGLDLRQEGYRWLVGQGSRGRCLASSSQEQSLGSSTVPWAESRRSCRKVKAKELRDAEVKVHAVLAEGTWAKAGQPRVAAVPTNRTPGHRK
jgi:hypothetical protein